MANVFQLTGNSLSVAPGTKILKAENLQNYLETAELLEKTKKRAEEILQEAEHAYEERKEQGYLDGQLEGKMEHAEKIMETVLSSVEFIENIENTVVDIVHDSIVKVIGELDDDERIVRIVRTALQHVRNQQQVIIRVAPEDEKYVRSALAAMVQNRQGGGYLDISADPRLTQGACILESELGVIDASLDTQLKAIENALRNKIKNG